MVKHFKTKRRHISKRLKIRKNNKTRKYIKKIGGGKTKEEIIAELKAKGRYDEWVKLGSYFGQTSYTSKAKSFLTRPYKYYDIDGNIVNVSIIDSTYRPDVDNIAIFKRVENINNSNVSPGTYRIVNLSLPLTTTGLATCTGFVMNIGTKKFMAHLDALTDIQPIVDAINKTIVDEKVDKNKLIANIYAGDLDSSITLEKAKDICSSLGIPEKNVIISEVCMFDIIGKEEEYDDSEW